MNFIRTISLFLLLLSEVYLFAQQLQTIDLVNQYVQSNDEEVKAIITHDLMEANTNLSKKDAREYYQKLKIKSKENGDPKYEVLGLSILADVYYYKGDKDSSFYYYYTQAKLAENKGLDGLAAFAFGNSGYILSDKGVFHEAIKMYHKSLTFSNRVREGLGNGDAYYNLGSIYSRMGKLDSSAYYYKKAIDIDRQIGDIRGIMYDYHILINLAVKSNQLDEALSYCKECITLGEKSNELNPLSGCYLLKAEIETEKSNFDVALNDINKAIALDNERKDDSRMAKHLRIKAQIYEFLDPNKAKSLYKEAIQISDSISHLSEKSVASLNLAELYKKEGKIELTKIQLDKTGEWIKGKELELIREKWLNANYELYKELGQFDRANYYLELKNEMLERSIEENLDVLTEDVNQSYDLYKIQEEFKELELRNELAELKAKRKNNLFIFLGVLLLISALLAYFAFENQKNKNLAVLKIAEEDQLKLNYQVLEKELDALRSQMNPHFLFNSLNSINDYIMHQEPRLASKYLTKFSHLMRTILNNSKKKFINLSDELRSINLYLEMEKLRFNDRFEFRVDIDPSISLEDTYIPSMLIQPYIENAIKHGFSFDRSDGHVFVNINKLEDGRLEIKVLDNGIGRKKAMAMKSSREKGRRSYGMNITSSRVRILNEIYDVGAQINYVDHVDPSGTEVVIHVKPLTKNQINE